MLLPVIGADAQDLPPALAARFSQGVAELKAGQLDAAEATFRDVLLAGGERAFVHHNLGLVLRERGRQADALNEFRAATKLDPAFGPARLLAGTSLLALARAREARSELEHAVRLMPREVVAYLELADACQRLDDRACVADAFRHVAQLAPDDPEYAYRLGSAYLKLSQWSHERIAKTNPASARLHQALAREYEWQGRMDLAVTALQRAAEADPTLPDIHLALARIHFDQGRFDEAAREIARELALVPFGRDALALKARIQGARRAPFVP
jgi:tetratricopeptide (TPR) repeat protein